MNQQKQHTFVYYLVNEQHMTVDGRFIITCSYADLPAVQARKHFGRIDDDQIIVTQIKASDVESMGR